MTWFSILLAEAEPPQGGPPPLFQSPIIPMMIIVGVFVLMMTRSSARQRREQQNLIAKVKKNDKVVTSAGILGVVVAVKENEDEVTLRVDDTSNSRIRVLKSTIVRVTSEEQQADSSGDNKTS
jgi:preprotein translocase subunit YajC